MTRAPLLNWHSRQFARPCRQKGKPCAQAIEPRQGALPGAQDHPRGGRTDNVGGLVANRAPLSPGAGPYPAAKIVPMVARATSVGWWPTACIQAPARGLTRPQDHRGDGRAIGPSRLGANRVSLSPGGTAAEPLILTWAWAWAWAWAWGRDGAR